MKMKRKRKKGNAGKKIVPQGETKSEIYLYVYPYHKIYPIVMSLFHLLNQIWIRQLLKIRHH